MTTTATFPIGAGNVIRFISSRTFPRTATEIRYDCYILSPAELASVNTTEKYNREPRPIMDTATIREAAQEILAETKRPKSKPYVPKHEGVKIEATANGFVVATPRPEINPAYVYMSGAPTPQKPYTFETFESLVKWLRANIARPDKAQAAK